MSPIPFLLLAIAIVSLWIRKDPKIWWTLLGLTLISALYVGSVKWLGVLITALYAFLWYLYKKESRRSPTQVVLFLILVALGLAITMKFLAGFSLIPITPRFQLGIGKIIVGFFPLALLVPLAKSRTDWKIAFTKGLWLTLTGIAVLAALAVASHAVFLQFKLPTYPFLRYFNNAVFVVTTEEAFYRGFMQHELTQLFKNTKWGKGLALILTSFVFTIAHIFWSPGLGILLFVFLAGLLYGGVYLYSGRIESAMLCHFLLNFVHMTFFSYHAM